MSLIDLGEGYLSLNYSLDASAEEFDLSLAAQAWSSDVSSERYTPEGYAPQTEAHSRYIPEVYTVQPEARSLTFWETLQQDDTFALFRIPAKAANAAINGIGELYAWNYDLQGAYNSLYGLPVGDGGSYYSQITGEGMSASSIGQSISDVGVPKTMYNIATGIPKGFLEIGRGVVRHDRDAMDEAIAMALPFVSATKWVKGPNRVLSDIGYDNLNQLTDISVNGVKAQRVLQGQNGKVAIIGRKMAGDQGVIAYKEALAKQGFDVEIFDSPEIGRLAKQDFARLKADRMRLNNGQGLIDGKYAPPQDIIFKSELYKINKDWARTVRSEGYTIVDIGDPMNFNKLDGRLSEFYEMERRIIFDD